MRPFFYWTGATVLVVTLLAGLFLTGEQIAESGWPFQRVWGAFIAALGLLIALLSLIAPATLWRIGTPEPDVLGRATRVGSVFGLLILLSGALFALTTGLWILIGGWAIAVAYLRLALPIDRDSRGPAA